MSLNGTSNISYFAPGEEMKPAALSAFFSPCPNRVSWLAIMPRLNDQSFQWITSFTSRFSVWNSEWMTGIWPVVCGLKLATKYAGLAVPQALAGQLSELPGMVITPQPFEVW